MLAHKKQPAAGIGPNMTWCFEDRLTIQYQVQEMLRVEKIFETAGIPEELECLQSVDSRRQQLEGDLAARIPRRARNAATRWRSCSGVEDRCWVRSAELRARCSPSPMKTCRVENDDKTSAVHFLRFELDSAMCRGRQGRRER